MSLQNICAQWSKSKSGIGTDGRVHTGPAILLEAAQTDRLATVLSRAYYDEPQVRYIMPDEQVRLRLLPNLFRVAIHASQLHDETYTAQSVDGGALWIGPGSGLTVDRMMRTRVPAIPIQLGSAALRRWVRIGLHLSEVHQRLVRREHWYLLALGAVTPAETESARATLIEPLLSRADSDGRPCYLETFNAKDLPFYERHGFRIAGAGKIAKFGPDFWAMIRNPQSASYSK